jgi:hypothetical protein
VSTNVGIVNASTLVTDDQVTPVVAALRTQVTRHFAPAWGRSAILHQIAHGHAAPKAAWQLILLDDSDQADALGYHDLTQRGPTAREGVPARRSAGGRELERHGQPRAARDAGRPLDLVWRPRPTTTTLYAVEVGDPCEADQFGYQVDGVLLSRLRPAGVVRAWHRGQPQARLLRPDQHAAGAAAGCGYCSTLRLGKGGGWQQQYAEHEARSFRMRPHVGSRRERRRTPRADWLRSTA